MLDELNPMAKVKNEAIAKLAPIVEQKGDVAKGKALFTTTCAICHKFGDVGTDIGPGLTGMGTHGAGELLTAIVDPNARGRSELRRRGTSRRRTASSLSGIIAARKPGDHHAQEPRRRAGGEGREHQDRVNTGRSLMPEGFEGLGGEALRDIIAYMQSVDGGKFRTLDLRDAFTASTRARPLHRTNAKQRHARLRQDRHRQFGGVPFNIVAPGEAATGMNIVVLKGGPRELLRQDAAAARRGEGRRLQSEPAALPRRRRRLGLSVQRRTRCPC